MKRTRKFLSAIALILVMATFLTSCAVNYATADLSKYVSVTESTYNGVKVDVDKTVYAQEVILQQVWNSLRSVKTAEDGTKLEGMFNGTVEKFDTVNYYHYAIDKDGNVVHTSIYRDEEGNMETETLNVGYGTNKELFKDIEKMIYDTTDPDNIIAVDIKDHLGMYETEKSVAIPKNAIWFIADAASSKANSTLPGTWKKSQEFIVNVMQYLDKEEQGKNDYLEAIALGFAHAAEIADGSEDKPGAKIGTLKTIRVYPTAYEGEMEADSASGVSIRYDIDFDTVDGKEYDQGVITVNTEAAFYMAKGNGASEGYEATPISFTYTFPESYTAKYTLADGKTQKTVGGTETTMYIYLVSRTAYTMPEYNPTTDEEKTALVEAIKGVFKSDLTDVDELKAAYETSVREKLEHEFVHEAETAARQSIWDAVVSGATVVDPANPVPKANVDAYVRAAKNNIKYYYSSVGQYTYDKSGSLVYVTPKSLGIYKSYKDYAVAMYSTDEEYKNQTVKTFDDVEAILRNEGTQAVKEMMLAYVIAEKLGLSVSEELYNETVAERAAEWIKEIQEQEKASAGMHREYTVKDYVDSVGEDNIRGGILIEMVKDKLYEMNKSGVTYKENVVNVADEEATEEKTEDKAEDKTEDKTEG